MGVTVEILFGGKSSADAETFAALYEKWFAKTVDLCRRTGCGDDDPEDVAQEAFLKAWSAWSGYRTGLPFWPWLATIAARSCVDHWRRTVRTATRDERVYTSGQVPVTRPDEFAEESAEWELIGRAFKDLKPADRRVMSLRDIEGWSYNDIAVFENVSIDSVRATLHRARAALRDAYLKSTAAAPIAIVLRHGKGLWARVHAAGVRAHRGAVDASVVDWAGVTAVGAAAMVLSVLVPPSVGGDVPSRHGPGGTYATASTAPVDSPMTSNGAVSGRAGAAVDAAMPGIAAGGAPDAAGSGPDPAAAPAGAVEPTTPVAVPRLPFDTADQPESGYLTGFASNDDGTVYGWGSSFVSDCKPALSTPATCKPVFRSTDGGHTWVRLAASGYTGGGIVVAPGAPKRLFSPSANELLHSIDGGATFALLLPAGHGSAAVSPAFSTGDPRLLLSGPTGWEYRDGAQGATPVTTGLPTGQSRSFTFAPAYPRDDRVLVSSTAAGPADGGTGGGGTTTQPGTVTVCRANTCGTPRAVPGINKSPSLAVAPSYAATGVVFAYGSKMYRSTDGGASFDLVPLPNAGTVEDVSFASDDTMFVAMRPSISGGGGVFRSHDLGHTWTRLGMGTALEVAATAIEVTRSGRVLAAPTNLNGGGVLCSADGGDTWEPRCPK